MSPLTNVRAWQAAIQVAVRTRALLAHFPRRGYADLRDQMIRSSEAIGHNIAEGHDAEYPLDEIRFLDTAARSAGELTSQITDAIVYGIVPKWPAFNLNGTVICTKRMVESLLESKRAEYEAEQVRKRAARKKKARKKSPKSRKN